MMEDTVRLDRLADDKVHNSEFYRFKTRGFSLPRSAKLSYKQTALNSPVKTVLNFPVKLRQIRR